MVYITQNADFEKWVTVTYRGFQENLKTFRGGHLTFK
jgi:hypothetical protein